MPTAMERSERLIALMVLFAAPVLAADPGWVFDRTEDVPLRLDGVPLPLRAEMRTADAAGGLTVVQVAEGDGWRSVVVEAKGETKAVRVHCLAAALTTSGFRILVRGVAAADGQARLPGAGLHCRHSRSGVGRRRRVERPRLAATAREAAGGPGEGPRRARSRNSPAPGVTPQ
jgi:hypothetical protein